MPFIGNQPALSYTSFAKQDFTTSATTSYTLDYPVANANELALFINFVRQEPTTAYSASGTSLTLTSATSASDDMYCVFLGKAVQTVNPPNGSVGTAQLASGVLPTNTPAWFVKKSAVQSISANTFTDVTYDVEVVDTDNAFASNVFTVPSGQGGKYLVFGQCRFETNVDFDGILSIIAVNGTRTLASWGANQYYNFVNITGILDLSAGDVVKHVCLQDSGGALNLGNADQGTVTFFGGYKIIE